LDTPRRLDLARQSLPEELTNNINAVQDPEKRVQLQLKAMECLLNARTLQEQMEYNDRTLEIEREKVIVAQQGVVVSEEENLHRRRHREDELEDNKRYKQKKIGLEMEKLSLSKRDALRTRFRERQSASEKFSSRIFYASVICFVLSWCITMHQYKPVDKVAIDILRTCAEAPGAIFRSIGVADEGEQQVSSWTLYWMPFLSANIFNSVTYLIGLLFYSIFFYIFGPYRIYFVLAPLTYACFWTVVRGVAYWSPLFMLQTVGMHFVMINAPSRKFRDWMMFLAAGVCVVALPFGAWAALTDPLHPHPSRSYVEVINDLVYEYIAYNH